MGKGNEAKVIVDTPVCQELAVTAAVNSGPLLDE